MLGAINKRAVLAQFVGLSTLTPFVRRCSSWNGLLVLNYHRIGCPDGSPFDWEIWSASVDQFDSQVSYLTQHFDIVGPQDLDRVRRDSRGRSVMITFDDGYRDNFDLAYPVLKKHGATATFFISTGFLDQPHLAWWDEIAWMVRTSERSQIDANIWFPQGLQFNNPDRCRVIAQLLSTYKRLPKAETDHYLTLLADATGTGRAGGTANFDQWMSWDMVREMRRGGMSIGGHTVSHPVLAQQDMQSQEEEIATCKRRIESELGESIDVFSYPVGSQLAFTAETKALLQKSGFRAAFSYYGGYSSDTDWDFYDLRRVAIERNVDIAEFRALTVLPQLFA